MKKYFVLVSLLIITVFCKFSVQSSVVYDGEIFDTQHAQSNGDEAGAGFGAKATITPYYEIPDIVAIGIHTSGEISSTPLLSGKFWANSTLSINNEADILNDIVKSGNEVDQYTNSQVLKINGVVYSSSSSALVTVEPLNQGGSNSVPGNSISVQFNNQTNSGSIDVAINGLFTGLSGSQSSFTGDIHSISNSTNLTLDSTNRGVFALKGDVIENSVTKDDDVGVYQGTVKITVSSF